jgi:hypothetical protein
MSGHPTRTTAPVSRYGMVVALALGLACLPATGVSAPLSLDPETACSALADVGLGARGGYRGRPGGTHRCDSRRKTIIAGNAAQDEIRFSALGSEHAVDELRLELTIRSRGNVQRAHRRLAEYADQLTRNTLALGLPAPVNEAILSAVNGEWTGGGRDFALRRTTVADGLYALRLTIR